MEKGPKKTPNSQPDQLLLNFDVDEENRERLEVAAQYKVANPKTLVKRDGKWYKDDMLVEEWDKLFSEPTNDAWSNKSKWYKDNM